MVYFCGIGRVRTYGTESFVTPALPKEDESSTELQYHYKLVSVCSNTELLAFHQDTQGQEFNRRHNTHLFFNIFKNLKSLSPPV